MFCLTLAGMRSNSFDKLKNIVVVHLKFNESINTEF